MSAEHVPVTVTILDKEYRIACPPDEQNALLASADHLNNRMKEIRDSGKIVGTDRIAVMVALNLTHELLTEQNERQSQSQNVNVRLQSLQDRIGHALEDNGQLEL